MSLGFELCKQNKTLGDLGHYNRRFSRQSNSLIN